MTPRERLTVAAALAVALSTSALAAVYSDLDWLARVLGSVAVVAAAGLAQRRLGVPRLLQPVVSAGALLLYTSLVFAPGTLALGVPTSDTFRALGELVGQGLLDVEQLVPPVPTHPGLVLLAVLGVGAVALVVDVVAALLARPAVAGLPLLLLYVVPSAVLADGLGWLPFALGASGWLALLLVEGADRVERWGSAVRRPSGTRRGDTAGVGRVGRRIGLAAVGVAVVVPATLPGLDARLVDSAGTGGDGPGLGGGPRTATTYNPITRLRSDLVQPAPQPLIRYRTDDANPDYLRLTTLDLFDGTGWSSSQLNGDRDDDAVRDGIPRPAGLTTASTRDVRTRMSVERLRTRWLPVPFPPTDIEIDGPWVWDRRAETAFSTGTSTGALDEGYEVRSLRVEPAAGDLADIPSRDRLPDEVRHYVDRPALTPYVLAQTEQAVDGARNDFEAVKAIQDYFLDADRFRYSTSAEVPGIDSPDALEAFLLGGQGFCEQYASAMAAMVRALGLPARVAVGFTRGTRAEGDEWVVTTSDAHAWPEVWFPSAGWVRFEPTPRSGSTEVPDYATTQATGPDGVSAPSDGSDDPAAEPTPSASPGGEDGVPDKLDRLDDDPVAAPAVDVGPLDDTGGTPVVPLVVALGLVALAAPAAGTEVVRRRRRHAGDPLVAWAQLQQDAEDVGHRWDGAETPRRAAARLRSETVLGDAGAAALDRVVVAVERARYAPPADGVQTAVWDDVTAVRGALLAGAPVAARWRARLMPPSALRSASAWAGSTTADALDAVDAALAAAGRRARALRGA